MCLKTSSLSTMKHILSKHFPGPDLPGVFECCSQRLLQGFQLANGRTDLEHHAT